MVTVRFISNETILFLMLRPGVPKKIKGLKGVPFSKMCEKCTLTDVERRWYVMSVSNAGSYANISHLLVFSLLFKE